MKKFNSTFVGFVVAPVLPAFIFALFTPISEPVLLTPVGLMSLNLPAVAGLTFAFYFYSFFLTCLVGVPAYLMFYRLNHVRWWTAFSTGFLCGILFSIGIMMSNANMVIKAKDVVFWGGSGGLEGILFWFIWRAGLTPRKLR